MIQRSRNLDRGFGKILWMSDKDKNGVVKDGEGNEYYFDISVVYNDLLLNENYFDNSQERIQEHKRKMRQQNWDAMLDDINVLSDKESNCYISFRWKKEGGVRCIKRMEFMQGRFVELSKDKNAKKER